MALSLSAWKFIHIWIIGVRKAFFKKEIWFIFSGWKTKLILPHLQLSWMPCDLSLAFGKIDAPHSLHLLWHYSLESVEKNNLSTLPGALVPECCRKLVHTSSFLLLVLQAQPAIWFQCSYLLHDNSENTATARVTMWKQTQPRLCFTIHSYRIWRSTVHKPPPR